MIRSGAGDGAAAGQFHYMCSAAGSEGQLYPQRASPGDEIQTGHCLGDGGAVCGTRERGTERGGGWGPVCGAGVWGGEGAQERQWKVGAGLSQEEPPGALRSRDWLSESQGLGRPQALRLPALLAAG